MGSRYPLDPTVEAVEVLLTTGGMPMNARIEILQGPDTNKQAGPGTHTEELVSYTEYDVLRRTAHCALLILLQSSSEHLLCSSATKSVFDLIHSYSDQPRGSHLDNVICGGACAGHRAVQ